MSTSKCEDLIEEKTFDWNKYLTTRNVNKVPEEFFHHVCKSELNGIEIGSIVEIENDDQDGYFFAVVRSSNGILLNLHYFGDDNDKHNFTLGVNSPRIHYFNWGSDNDKKLVPPYPERFSRFSNLKLIKEKVEDCEQIVSDAVLQMEGAPIYNIFKCDMCVEVQDKEYPYRVWISKVLKNVGGRLLLQMQGINSPEKEPFWLFYLNERVFPLGWAEQKGLPWRVMNLDANLENNIDSNALLNVLKPKTPEQHNYKVGYMLEVINPYSLMVFYVATIVKIYDNRYFKVEVNNESDIDKRISFVATKENPYLFNAGWASKHKFLLKPPSDWDKPYKFSWSKYAIAKDLKFAYVDNSCRKEMNNIYIGMKLEAVDPLNTSCIRVATVKGFADHWMFLSFDRTSRCQELLHVRSVYSDEIFPVGWCNKHEYSLSVPKRPYNDSNDFKHCYYSSDVDIDLSQSDQETFTKYPHYLKGEIIYHFSNKDKKHFDDGFEEFAESSSVKIEDVLIDTIKEIKTDSENESENENENNEKENENENNKKEEDDNKDNIFDVKDEPPEIDDEFRDALFAGENVSNKIEFIEDEIKSEEEDDNKIYGNVNHVSSAIVNIIKNSTKMISRNSYKMCIYFNKDCYPGGHVVRKKIQKIPYCIGPGPVSKVLQKAITQFVDVDYIPSNALKKIKKIQHMLFNGPGGVEMLIKTAATKTHPIESEEYLLLPESRKMAKSYCSALCNLSGMCEFFMTTEDSNCPHGCNIKNNKALLLAPRGTKNNRKAECEIDENRVKRKRKRRITNSDIARVAANTLDWTNKSLIARYKYYMGVLIHLEAHIYRLNQSCTELETSLITEIIAKKNFLKTMNNMNIFSNTKSHSDSNDDDDEFIVFDDWKTTFENYYRNNVRFKKFKIDIGQIEPIKITSNPKFWTAEDVYKYLVNDLFCKDVGLKLFNEEVDGVAFMLLNEEQLLLRLRCTINLAIRIMCHVAEVKYVCLTKYCNVQVSI